MRKSLRLEVKCNEDAPAPSYLIQLVTEKTTTAPPELEKGNLSYPARKILRCGHWYCRLCTVAIVDASTLRFFIFIFLFADNIFYVNGHYVRYTMLVQRFEPQGRRFTNFHYYYYREWKTEQTAWHTEDVKTKRRASKVQLQSLAGSLSWPCQVFRGGRVFLRHIVDTIQPKLQTLVYNILPSTTAIFSYAIRSRKLSANEQLTSSFFVTNNSNKTRRVIYSRQQSLHQH